MGVALETGTLLHVAMPPGAFRNAKVSGTFVGREKTMAAVERHGRSWSRAVGIGILVSILTAVVMLALTAAGMSPFPKPPSLAFAETVLMRSLPLPVGLLFHTVYVTFWCVVYVRYFSEAGYLDRVAACGGSLGDHPCGLLPHCRMGLCGAVCQPKTDCGVLRAASPVRIAAVGIGQVPAWKHVRHIGTAAQVDTASGAVASRTEQLKSVVDDFLTRVAAA
ncbi:hypothetical protein QW131_32550 [Roseibium salinum]|nr:hypothetical protein [Roseibium salinum]